MPIPTTVLRRGDRGPAVAALHRTLESLQSKVDRGERDHRDFGAATEALLRDYQKQAAIPTTGVFDDATRASIESTLHGKAPFSVHGTVTDANGSPVVGAAIVAVDLDLRRSEVLGQTTTDCDGEYEVRYSSSKFTRAEKDSADLVVRAQIGDRLVAESAVRFNAPADLQIDLGSSEHHGPSEYERLKAAIDPLLDGTAPGDLADSDVAFLAGETGLDAALWLVFVRAQRLSASTVVVAAPPKQGAKPAPVDPTGIPPEAFYGWLRAELPADWEQLRGTPISVLRSTLIDAVAGNRIPAWSSEQIDQILGRFPNAEHTELKDLLGATIPADTAHKVLGAVDALDAVSDQLLSSLIEANALAAGEAELVGLTVSLHRLAGPGPAVISAILNTEFPAVATGKLQRSRDLAALAPADWARALDAAGAPIPDGMSRATHARGLAMAVSSAFPEDAFRRQAAQVPPGLPDAAKRFQIVASANQAALSRTFDALDLSRVPAADHDASRAAHATLRSLANLHPGLGLHEVFDRHPAADAANIAAQRIGWVNAVFEQNPAVEFHKLDYVGDSVGLAQVDFGELPDEARKQVVTDLKAQQRVHSVTANAIPALELLQAGFSSASAIAVLPRAEFAARSGLDVQEAVIYHATAFELSNNAAVTWFALYDHARDRATTPVRVIPSRDQFLRPLEGYARLLDDQPWCACEKCQSVLSPAAYFVDLMHYVEQSILAGSFESHEEHPLHLERRRPDLWDLELTCANTTDPVPQLDLVNEILERYLKDVVPFDDTTALYRHLAEDDHSFGQPFTLPLVRLGVLLEHFGVTRYDVAKAMQAGRAAQARARLGLSLKDYQLITTERQDDAGFLLKLFRITSDVTAPNAILAPVEMASLVRAIGLPHDTVASVLHTEFVAVTGAEAPPVEIVLGKRDPGDVQNNSEMVTNLTLRRLDRVHRFVRLWRTLSWTIDELDYVLARLVTPWPVAWIIPDNTDAMGTLEQIVKQLDVNAGWQLPVDELLALTDEFPARGLREATSLFDRLFNQPAFVGRDGVWGPQLAGRFTHPSWTKAIVGGEPDSPVGHSIPADNTLLRLLAGLQLSDAEFVELVAGLRSLEAIDYRPAGENGAESIALSRASIGALYRHARLRRLLGCSVADFLRILRLAPFVSRGSRPIEFIRSIDDVRCAVEFAAWQRTSGFTLDEIRYLIDATTKGELDPAGLAAQIVASAKAEHSLEFADTLFTQLELTEAQSRELVAINVSRAAGDGLPFESSLGAYRVRAGGTAGLVIPAALATRVDAAAVRGLLEGHGALHVLDVALGRALGRPLDEVAVLRAIAEPPAQLDTAAIARAIQGGAASADTDRLVTLIARMARFQVLLRSAVFDLAGLQFVAAAPAVLFGATAAAPLTTTPAITLDVVRNVAAYVALAAATDTGFTTASGPADLAAIRRVVVDVGAASDADLAHALRTDESRIGALRPHLALPDGMFDALAAIDRCLAIAKQLGVSGETLRLLVEESTPSAMFDGLARAAEDVFGAFRAKYPDERTFADKLEPFDDKLRARKRDGLVDYLVTGLATPFADPSKLYEYFLIDVMVEGCARTSRVVAATSSLQLYVHRVLMNLERSRDWDPMDTTNTGVRAHFTSADKRSEWQWRQHYRVWEANRRVFLYPENYLEPELRDDKTPLFEDLEDSLLLQEIDKASVHDAYSRYLTGFDEVARLKIAGAYYDSTARKLHLFGVTQDDAPVYYYREVDDSGSSAAAQLAPRFSAWHKLTLQIPVRAVSPIVFEGRLYVFWVETTTRPVNSIKNGSAEFSGYRHLVRIKYAMLRPDGAWSSPQAVRFAEGGGTAEARLVEDPRDDAELHRLEHELEALQKLVGDRTSAVTTATEPARKAAEDAAAATTARSNAEAAFKAAPTPEEIAIAATALLFTGTPFEVTFFGLRQVKLSVWQVSEFIAGQAIEASRIATDKLNAAKDSLRVLNEQIAQHIDAIDHQITRVRWDASRRNHLDALDSYKPEGWQWDRVYPDVYTPPGGAEPFLRITLVPNGNRLPELSPVPGDFEASAGVLREISELARVRHDGSLSWSSGTLKTATPLYIAWGGQLFFGSTLWLQQASPLGSVVAVGPATSDVQIVNGQLRSVIMESQGDAVWMLASGGNAGIRLGTSLTRELSRQFWHDGADSLLDPIFQQGLSEVRSKISPIAGQSEPARQNPFHPDSACLTYFRETFFHIPFLVANHLNSQNKFSDTQRWYHYIFDPTAEQGDPWRYREFREPAIGTTSLRQLLTNDKALAAYRKNPFSPHAIARTRMTAYQKAIVMKYVDNLLDWGDTLFNQFTMESINEATMLYVMAQDILGPRPTVLGSCGEGKVSPRTYRNIRPGLSDVSDFLVELEAPPSVHALKARDAATRFVVPLQAPQQLTAIALAAPRARAAAAAPRAVRAPAALAVAGGFADSSTRIANVAAGTPVASRENKLSIGTVWTSNGGTPLSTLRDGPSATSAVVTLGADTTVSLISGGGSSIGVTGGQRIVAYGELDTHQLDVSYAFNDVFEPGGFQFHYTPPSHRYPAAAIVPPKNAVFCIPPNDDLLAYWGRVEDRLFKIRNCMDIAGVRRQLALFAPELDPRMLVRMTAAGLSIDDVLNSTSGNLPPYRFAYLIDKAKQHAASVQSFGAQLLSALEKGDAEELNHLRAVHEQNLLKMRTKVAQLEISAAEDAIEGLRRQQAAVENRQQHFTSLREVGQIAGERKQQELQGQASSFRSAAGIAQVVASILTVIPDMGAFTAMKFGGSQLGAAGRAVAEGLNALAAFNEVAAARAGVEASNQRRDQEWQHQVETARLELAQLEKTITAAEIRRDIAVQSLAVHEQTVAQTEEMFDFFREKFSSVDRYRLLSKELRRLYRLAFGSALTMARMAEQAYRAERPGDDALLAGDYWDAESAGLLAGERLVIDLQRFERQFIESNYRELEVEHSFSLAQFAPDELAALRLTGECQFIVPEWFFDLTYPGQYRRRLKSVRVTIPCVTGPYANIGATLRLDSSQIRLAPPLTGQPLGSLTAVPPRHTVSIATSKAQNDAGVFDFSFRDERYMPFEGAGAIGTWTLSLPRTLRVFDYGTINDVILHLDYTAQYDEGLKQRWDGVAHELMTLLGASPPADPPLTRTFSLRGDFPDVFHRLVTSPSGTAVDFALDSRHFPGFTAGRDRHLEAASAALSIFTPLRALPATSLAIARKATPPQLFKEVAAPAVPDVDGGELCEFDLGDVFKTPLDQGGVLADVVGSYAIKLATGVDPRDLQDIVLRIGYRLVAATPAHA